MFEEQVKKDAEIKASIKELDSFGRIRLVGCLADLQPVMQRIGQKDCEIIREEMGKLTLEEQVIALQIWLNNFLERNRFGEIIRME